MSKYRVLVFILLAVSLATAFIACAPPAEEKSVYDAVLPELEQYIAAELEKGYFKGVTIALVDGEQMIWCKGFGYADVDKRIPAAPETVYRPGSISKLFTDVAIMQQVEAGVIDIDADIRTWLPDFAIENPFPDAKPVTLRTLMTHSSGLPRESPVGSYFDDTFPSIEETVRSIYSTRMIYPPETMMKYSNIGVTVVGHILEKMTGEGFVDYQRRALLGPLGMTSSDFVMNDELMKNYAAGYMWVAGEKGGDIVAPRFELATVPAGNLYSTAPDLAKFLICMINGGAIGDTRILKPETVEQMFTVQFSTPDQPRYFGLGFVVGNFNGHKTIGHTGAVYGFTSIITGLPEEKLGVVVLVNEDIATGPLYNIHNKALSLMLKAKLGEEPKPAPAAAEVTAMDWQPLIGDYDSEVYWASVIDDGGKPSLILSGQKMELRPLGPDEYIASNRLVAGAKLTFTRAADGVVTGMQYGSVPFTPVSTDVAPIPEPWKKYLGAYGKEFIPVIISWRNGALWAFLENEYDYRLTPMSDTLFNLPKSGMYQDQQIEFVLDDTGAVKEVVMAFVHFPPLAR